MATELLVAGIVRTLAEHAVPLDGLLADRAVAEAVRAFCSGASPSEACRVGLLAIAGHHPSDSGDPARHGDRVLTGHRS